MDTIDEGKANRHVAVTSEIPPSVMNIFTVDFVFYRLIMSDPMSPLPQT